MEWHHPHYPILANFAEAQKNGLRERFHQVILKAGYSEIAAQGILEEWFEKYYAGDRAEFIKMLEEYEKGRGEVYKDDEDSV
jgi:hypothetical protein